MTTNIQIRRDASQATLDRFRDRPFKLGTNDCGKMVAFHLRKMGIDVSLAKLGSYSTPISARASLRRAFGVDTLMDWADQNFERINPAQALVGDIIELPGSGSPIGAFAIYIGHGLVIGYVEGEECATVSRIKYDDQTRPLGAWRTLPL